jgi:hypothetical protein
MKYGLYRMLCALALTRFPNWVRRYGSQELANSPRRINGILTGRQLLIHLSVRISKNVERVTGKEYFQSLSLLAPSYLTTFRENFADSEDADPRRSHPGVLYIAVNSIRRSIVETFSINQRFCGMI